MRIPNKVVLPFGYHIMIRQVTDSEMDRQDANADGIWDNEAKPSISASGFRLRDGVTFLPTSLAVPGSTGSIAI